MTKYYKGQRITELLENIEDLNQVLKDNHVASNAEEFVKVTNAWATLAIMKAKLTALQGESND